jgi:predicted CXXCH cytochrome family protein
MTSLLFDGVPAPPPPEEYCSSWLASKAGNGSNGAPGAPGSAKKAETVARPKGSIHLPFGEKRCDDCHDRTKGTGLLVPKDALCFTCHDSIVKGAFAHAPAVSGECLACHLPHDSSLPSLLKVENGKLCGTCHAEQRSYATLHQRVAQKNIPCYDCHNPHAGDNRYFLK